jgi:flagellar motor switch protein FliM
VFTDRRTPAARHCPELLGGSANAAELGGALSELAELLLPALSKGLSRLAGGEAPRISKGMPRDCKMATIGAEAAALASHGIISLGVDEEVKLLVSFDAAPVFRLVDRAFGGRGVVPSPLPTSFPLSAELLIARLEETVGTALRQALGGELPVRALQRGTQLSRIGAWPSDEPMMQLVLVVEEDGCEPWMLSLAFPHSSLASAVSGRLPSRKADIARIVADPLDEPYASLPVELTATLVDMKIGFSRLAELQPGDVIPVAIARSVPIRAGGRTIASGTVGELDDQVAIRITQAFQERN